MPLKIPRSLVEFILLGPEDDRRQLQDSPILGDVWVAFAEKPGEPLELLITPYKDNAAGEIASRLSSDKALKGSDIAYLQGIIAARLSLEQVLRHVVPMTSWWQKKRKSGALRKYTDSGEMQKATSDLLTAAVKWQSRAAEPNDIPSMDVEAGWRYIVLAGLILWARNEDAPTGWNDLAAKQQIAHILHEKDALTARIAVELTRVFREYGEYDGLVWTVSLNRRATAALSKSVPAVKADAARTLFRPNCSEIVWAVIDSGIDARHDAFTGLDDEGQETCRVLRTFDFTTIRRIVSLDNAFATAKRKKLAEELSNRTLLTPLSAEAAEKALQEIAEDARKGRPIDWKLVEKLVELQPKGSIPPSDHGTHVAGILGAAAERPKAAAPGAKPPVKNPDWVDGMCPDINIYDFRVLGPSIEQTEFAIIAALQYIRYINDRNSYMTIHGANLSLSIPHDVRNYACGRTPVCNECERLVNSGVVVVAAAGNRGYQNFETKDGLYESYAAFSVTDPGNADGVITVGATHRFWPHTYGVSFFSSRGPTGDGRMKPDLVAPGERIRAPFRDQQWGDLDGTSMAAPHVSGAAAMLMARYSELIGQPRRIKQILCDNATDLGRERSFQGRGMLDVLRAFQSV